MVSLSIVREHNSNLRTTLSDSIHTSLFVGATQGIGLGTLEQLLKHITNPKIYIVGRSASRFDAKLNELRALSPSASLIFIEAEVSLLHDVDRVCNEVVSKEKKLDLLFLSAGFLPPTTPEYTKEGIDKALTVSYYSRMRFTMNLLPLLENANADAINNSSPRVFSILNGGKERRLITDDLGLKKNYSFLNCADQATTMNTLAFEHLTTLHPDVAFLHSNPGHVRTNIVSTFLSSSSSSGMKQGRSSFFGLQTLKNLLSLLAKCFVLPIFYVLATSPEVSGERRLFEGTSQHYRSERSIQQLTDVVDKKVDTSSRMRDMASEKFLCSVSGNGVYRVTSMGDTVIDSYVLGPYREKGMPKKVWEHTMEVFEDVLGRAEPSRDGDTPSNE